MARSRTQRLEFGKDFDVSADWLELSGRKPARRPGIREHIYLVIEGYEFDPTNLDDLSMAINIDGRMIEPIVRVIDSNGDIYPTRDTIRWGGVIGLTILNGVTGKPISEGAQAVRIAIRSDEKFRCKAIGWNSHRMK